MWETLETAAIGLGTCAAFFGTWIWLKPDVKVQEWYKERKRRRAEHEKILLAEARGKAR